VEISPLDKNHLPDKIWIKGRISGNETIDMQLEAMNLGSNIHKKY
jgi:hypothetical protein